MREIHSLGSLGLAAFLCCCFSAVEMNGQDAVSDSDEIVVTATRTEVPLDEAPASTSIVTAEDFEQHQIVRAADALREVPGLAVVQTGTAGQLTSIFTRGLRSEHTQVLLNGIPLNQGLAGLMNFADFTTDDIERIEVVRGPQSTLYGPRALAGAIQMFTKRGTGDPVTSWGIEGGSFDTAREFISSSGKLGTVDYSLGLSRFDSEFERQNNNYRLTNGIADIGWSPNERLRIGSLFLCSDANAGSPNSIFDPRPFDRLITERWLIGPHIDFTPVEWWSHKLILDYDHERQINNPNVDGFVGPTRAVFERTQIDYQNNIRATKWLTVTSGFFYSRVNASQERPFVLFGDKFISDHTVETAGFAQLSLTPIDGLNVVTGGRYDHFNQFGDVWTWRVAGSYTYRPSGTTVHASVATGFSPPSSQDKIFGNNFGLRPERDLGWDAGVTQRLWSNRVTIGATYFHNDLTNIIGYNGLFETLNLGAARTQGVEVELRAQPIRDLTFAATYTYLDAHKTDNSDISQPPGARLPRRPRNEGYVSASYLWFGKLRTTAAFEFVNAREEINFGAANFDIEDYAFLNLAAEYAVSPHLTIFARIDNLTGERYSEVYGFPALGRAAYGGFRVTY